MKMTNATGTVLLAAVLVTAAVRAEDAVTNRASIPTDHLSFYTNYVSIYTNHVSIYTNELTILANRLSLSARFGFNISGKFKGIGNGLFTVPAPNPRRTLDGDAYNYDDGYVLTDSSGNFGGETRYWGYDDSASQILGNTVLLSRISSVSGKDQSADPTPGAELVYSRHLGVSGSKRYGLEIAVNYQSISFSDHSAYSATRVRDAFPYEPGTTLPTNSYQGRFDAPGFILGDTPVGSSTSVAVITGNHRFDGDLWGGRFGPYLEFPVTERLNISLSAGLALGLLDAEASWSESATLPSGGIVSASGKGSDFDMLWGGYARADAAYDLGKNWSLLFGLQFQSLGRYDHNIAGREVELDLRTSIFVTVGLGKSF